MIIYQRQNKKQWMRIKHDISTNGAVDDNDDDDCDENEKDSDNSIQGIKVATRATLMMIVVLITTATIVRIKIYTTKEVQIRIVIMMMITVTIIHCHIVKHLVNQQNTINMLDENDNYDDECKFILEQDIHQTTINQISIAIGWKTIVISQIAVHMHVTECNDLGRPW